MDLSAPLPRTKIDGRTRAARTIRDCREALLAGLCRAPTPAESFVIKRIAMYELKLRMISPKRARQPRTTRHLSASRASNLTSSLGST